MDTTHKDYPNDLTFQNTLLTNDSETVGFLLHSCFTLHILFNSISDNPTIHLLQNNKQVSDKPSDFWAGFVSFTAGFSNGYPTSIISGIIGGLILYISIPSNYFCMPFYKSIIGSLAQQLNSASSQLPWLLDLLLGLVRIRHYTFHLFILKRLYMRLYS